MKPDNHNCAYPKDFQFHLLCHIERGKTIIHRTRLVSLVPPGLGVKESYTLFIPFVQGCQEQSPVQWQRDSSRFLAMAKIRLRKI